MSESEFKYGTGFTSVKVHHAPGGQSNFSIGWEGPEPQRREAPPADARRRNEEEAERQRRQVQEDQYHRQLRENNKANPVQTSVKVKNPPGGQSSITFG